MIRATQLLALAGLGCLSLFTPSRVAAEEKADQVKRDPVRIAAVKSVAVAPVVIQLRFDRDDRLPDPNRMAARNAVASRLPAMIDQKLKGSTIKVLPVETLVLAMKQEDWNPTDLYVTKVQGSWETPGESMKNKKGDEALLLNSRSAMKAAPADMTLYRYRWHDLPDVCIGLAAFKDLAFPPLVTDRIKTLGARAGADAVLLCQVEDMETHTGSTLFSGFKSTRIHLHGTLVDSSDGAVLWQAHSRGVASQKAGFFTGASAFKGEDRKAIEGAMQAIDILLDDLLNGSGKPIAP